MAGEHNVRNCLAAVAAACHAGVKLNTAAKALQEFKGVARRQELRGEVNGIRVYDDFAHHPTAIAATLSGMAVQLKARANSSAGANPGRLIAVIDPRSSTMRSSTHQKALASCCSAAHMVLWHKPDGLGLDIDGLIKASKIPAHAFSEVDAIVEFLRTNCISGDHVLIMSNGGFGNIHRKLLDVLESHQP
ncbi:MAG: glutamate ligase domain-containing protein [Pseudohongiellaceae bacterium]